ncbi:MAG: hypothetical protein JXR77_06215, partial [Lentisphaeria bacterium]|nr:hypothetical protein [Lentisphaeria bacterium]
ADVPYSSGYCPGAGGWYLSWQITNTAGMQSWYMVEEEVNGRGRWLSWNQLDYQNPILGETLPVPGAYVLLEAYENDTWLGTGTSHSMMIDEMTVYYTVLGIVDHVSVTILEGNASDEVRNTRSIPDILQVIPGAPDWVDTTSGGTPRKIRGFGIDLDGNGGNPLYDPDRLHYIFVADWTPQLIDPVFPFSPEWDTHFEQLTHELTGYAERLRTKKGIRLRSSDRRRMSPRALPDASEGAWAIPPPGTGRRARKPLVLEIDLRAVHPLPVRGLMLAWAQDACPPASAYRVLFGVRKGNLAEAAVVPMPPRADALAQMGVIDDGGDGLTQVPVIFDDPGAPVRYVRLVFPPGEPLKEAVLHAIRFLYDWGPFEDSPENPRPAER